MKGRIFTILRKHRKLNLSIASDLLTRVYENYNRINLCDLICILYILLKSSQYFLHFINISNKRKNFFNFKKTKN